MSQVSNYEHSDYSELAFFSCFCCLPLGLTGMYFSNKSNNEYKKGNIKKAKKNNNITKLMIFFSVIFRIRILTSL